jgi:hypothetical protein
MREFLYYWAFATIIIQGFLIAVHLCRIATTLEKI